MTASLSKRITVKEEGVIRYYWRMWDAFLFTLLLALGFMSQFVFIPFPLWFVFMVLFISLGLIYAAIGFAINFTEFRVAGGELLIHHKPLPWRGNLSIPLTDIHKVTILLDKGDSEYGRRATDYVVVVNNPNAKRKITRLISGLNLENADVLAWELEKTLGKPHHPDRQNRIAKLKAKMIDFNSKQNR